MAGIERLSSEELRAALRALGVQDPPSGRAAAARRLRDAISAYGVVRGLLERAPDGARAAFVHVAQRGPASVEDLLGRGWWGHGVLPPPLDWLQRRALVVVGDDGLVHAAPEAAAAFAQGHGDLDRPAAVGGEALRVMEVGCVVVARTASALDRALTVDDAHLRVVAPTVAVSDLPVEDVRAALTRVGVALDDVTPVRADPGAPALAVAPERATGPRAIRALLERAVREERQVRLEYYASSRGGVATERVVDPWEFGDDLLSGYCHLRSGERTFAVDRIGSVLLLATPVTRPSLEQPGP